MQYSIGIPMSHKCTDVSVCFPLFTQMCHFVSPCSHRCVSLFPPVHTDVSVCFPLFSQIPIPDVAIHSLHIDSDGAYLAAVNSKVRQYWSCIVLAYNTPATINAVGK